MEYKLNKMPVTDVIIRNHPSNVIPFDLFVSMINLLGSSNELKYQPGDNPEDTSDSISLLGKRAKQSRRIIADTRILRYPLLKELHR